MFSACRTTSVIFASGRLKRRGQDRTGQPASLTLSWKSVISFWPSGDPVPQHPTELFSKTVSAPAKQELTIHFRLCAFACCLHRTQARDSPPTRDLCACAPGPTEAGQLPRRALEQGRGGNTMTLGPSDYLSQRDTGYRRGRVWGMKHRAGWSLGCWHCPSSVTCPDLGTSGLVGSSSLSPYFFISSTLPAVCTLQLPAHLPLALASGHLTPLLP